jgi:hypothetical protein
MSMSEFCKTKKAPCAPECANKNLADKSCRAKNGEGANYKGKKVAAPKANSPVKPKAVSPEVLESADEDVMMSLVFDLRLDDLETKPEESTLEQLAQLDEKVITKSLTKIINYLKINSMVQIYDVSVKENFLVLYCSAPSQFKKTFNLFLQRVKILNDSGLDSERFRVMQDIKGLRLSIKNIYVLNKVTPFNASNVNSRSKYLLSFRE